MKEGYDLPSEAPGKYLPVRSDKRVPFPKFYKPDTLPPDVRLSDDIVTMVARAMHALGRLDGFWNQVNEAETVFKPFLYKEAEQSSQIEGTQVTTTDIYRATSTGDISTRTRDVQEASNYVEALQVASEQLLERGRSREQITLDLIKDLHSTVMESGQTDENDPLPGEFRPNYAWIDESTAAWKQSVRFVPPKADFVGTQMDALEGYIQSDSKYPDLVDIALIHYQIETIHPFKDGNGRIGRLLIILMLVACDILTQPLFYMSAYLKSNRDEYTDRLLQVSEQGDWEGWLRFFLTGMKEQADEVLGRGTLLFDCYEKYQERYADAPESVNRLLDMLFQQPYLTVPMVVDEIDMTYPTANNAVQRFVDDEVLVQTDERERNREFVAVDVMEILERSSSEIPRPSSVLSKIGRT
jgi:Fic family protein